MRKNNTYLAINFYAENLSTQSRSEFMDAVDHENALMGIEDCKNRIASTESRISNIQKNKDMSVEDKKKAVDAENVKLEKLKTEKAEYEETAESTREVYDKVFAAMTVKNTDHFGNNPDVVRTVLRVLASVESPNFIKDAIIPAFQNPDLYNALETIHITSKASDDGALVMSKEVKDAYKKASAELETIIKTTFSLPFESVYTIKTRVKLTAEDKKLLHECYVKDFNDARDTNDETGAITIGKRTVKRLVKTKRNKKTNEVTYDYSGLAGVISKIVLKHYFTEK